MAENIVSAGAELLQLYDSLFGVSKNVARSIPNIRDGLKPVQRKILYTMNEMGKPDDTKKVGSIVGEVLKIYSHGDASVTDALIRMATPWGNIAPYLNGVGNFGCHDELTEVLTIDGWKPWPTITMDDSFATVSPYGEGFTYEKPSEITKAEYHGPIVRILNENLDLMVTPNHRLIARRNNTSVFAEAGKLTRMFHMVTIIQKTALTDKVAGILGDFAMDERMLIVKVLVKKRDIHMINYDGYVYCATVPTHHTLITRRNGKLLLSGNSPMGDAPAAARYIEAKLSPFARTCFFTDKLCIDMTPTYDNTRMEPVTLPCMFPTAIINGSVGAGFAASTNIPQYNLKDVIETTIKLIDNPKATCHMVPDSQWGCDIMSSKPFGKYKTSFDQIFETGYGSYVQKFRYHIDYEKNMVIVTALPAKIPLEGVLKEIERLQNETKAFPELKSMVDLSGKDHDDGIWVEFQLFNGKNPKRFAKKLESVKGMKKTQVVNVELVDGLEVNHYSIRSYILAWYQYRHDYIRACLSTELTNVNSDIAINDIKLFIFGEDRLEKTTDIYVSSNDTDEIIRNLMNEYSASTGMTSQQASILANMSGKDYTKSAYQKYKDLKESLQQEHDRLESILVSPTGISNIIKKQLKDGLKFARPRGAKIVGEETVSPDERYILAINPEKDTIIKLEIGDHSQKLVELLPQNLTAETDSTNDVIVFDNLGKYVVVNPAEIPVRDNIADGIPLIRFSEKQMGKLLCMESMDENCKDFVIITKMGRIKKINPRTYQNKVKNNRYIALDEGDSVISIIPIKNPNSHIVVYTDTGEGQRFPSTIIPVTAQTAAGQYGISVPDGNVIVGAFGVRPGDMIAYITSLGYIRLNQSRFFTARKNKQDWSKMFETGVGGKLAHVVTCSSTDTLHLVYSDLTTKDVPVKDLKVDMINSPPREIAHRAGYTILSVKLKHKK